MRKVLCLLVGCIVLAGVPGAFAGESLSKPGILNEEAVMTSQRLSTYDTLVIKDFSTDTTAYENIDDEEKPKVDAMKPLIVSTLSESLEMEMKTRKLFKTIARNSEAGSNAVILEGDFTEFNAGSRALRFWVGFGAGKTYLKVKGRLVDAQTGTVLATFEDQESGYKGVATMESFEDLFPHQAKGLAENIADFIAKLY